MQADYLAVLSRLDVLRLNSCQIDAKEELFGELTNLKVGCDTCLHSAGFNKPCDRLGRASLHWIVCDTGQHWLIRPYQYTGLLVPRSQCELVRD